METDELTALTAKIVRAYIANNAISAGDVPQLLAEVHSGLRSLGKQDSPEPAQLTPAVPIKRSVRPDAIICLEDGKKFKSLRRHLMTHHGLTPEQYRERWQLPRDYPMVASSYSERRSTLAKASGLGRSPAVEVQRLKGR